MARYLFLTWNGAGNQPPAIGIAQVLRERGHAVVFGGYESQRSYFKERGFDFMLLEGSSLSLGSFAPDRLLAALINSVWAASEHFQDVGKAISATRCEAVLVDCLMFAALSAVERAQIPAAVLVHSAPGALVPPGGMIDRAVLQPINHLRQNAELPPVRNLWEIWARFPAFCATIAELDPLAEQVPERFKYIGPVFERIEPSGYRLPWPADDERPLVLVSFSTGRARDQRSRVERTTAGLLDKPYRVLVTTGSVDVGGLQSSPNIVYASYVPHQEVLPEARAVVTHVGHGTLSAALSHGVPIVGLPNPVADQTPLAARTAALGAGLALEGETATPSEIATAVDEVVRDPAYAASARQLAAAIAAAPGAGKAANELEALAGFS